MSRLCHLKIIAIPAIPNILKFSFLSFGHDNVDLSLYCQHTHFAVELLHSYENGNSKTQNMLLRIYSTFPVNEHLLLF